MKKIRQFVFLFLTLFGIWGIVVLVQNTNQVAYAAMLINCTVDESKVLNDAEETKFLGLINTYRQQHNLSQLKISNTLNRAAAWLAFDFQLHIYLDHIDTFGRNPRVRMTNCGHPATASLVSENIADGSLNVMSTAQQAFNAWKTSPGHNANMLDSEVRFIGIARQANTKDMYWVTDFSTSDDSGTNPAPTSPVKAIPFPTTKPAPTVNPTNSIQLNFTVFLDGIGKSGDRTNPNSTGNTNPHFTTRNISLGIFNSSDTQVATAQSTMTYNSTNGNFTGSAKINPLPAGSYLVKITSERYLRKTLPGFQNFTGKTITLPAVTLVAGDITQDNIINIQDYNALMSCYSDLTEAQSCTERNKLFSDISDDTKVNQIDYNIFIRELGARNGD